MTDWANIPNPTLGYAYDEGGYGEGPYGGEESNPTWVEITDPSTTWTNESISESTTWSNAL